MVNYKKSVGAVALSASVAVAQNTTIVDGGDNTSDVGNHGVNVNQTVGAGGVQINFNDFVNGDQYADRYGYDYTTVIPALAPTGGWMDNTYTFQQICPTPCGQPDVPLGWDYVTTVCQSGCGAGPTPVKVLQAPWSPDCDACEAAHAAAAAAADQAPACPTCHVAIVEYCPPVPAGCSDDSCVPAPVSYSTVLSQPTSLPPAPQNCQVCQQPMGSAAPASPNNANNSPASPNNANNSPASPNSMNNAAQPNNANNSPASPNSMNNAAQPNSMNNAAQPNSMNNAAQPNSMNNADQPISAQSTNGTMGMPPVMSGTADKRIAGVATFLMACGVAIAALL